MALYKGIDLAPGNAECIRYMQQVDEYREELRVLQAAWDNLALLGHLSGTRIEIGSVRSSFAALTGRMVNNLASEQRRTVARALGAKAQVAIDILVRNLFERTADIGFLATDSEVRAFAEARPEEREPLREALITRFRDYQRKYSVYADVVLLSDTGEVLARLDESATVKRTTDPLVEECLRTSGQYVESYRAVDLFPGEARALLYSYRVGGENGKRPAGVLCLCFRLADECQRIFSSLLTAADWTVLALVDERGHVVSSSDPYQVPAGVPLPRLSEQTAEIVRYAGRCFLAAHRASGGYQGYMGPGWAGYALMPLEFAFETDGPRARAGDSSDPNYAGLLRSEALFTEDLREVPVAAGKIQKELNRAVWNGNVALARDAGANHAFSKTLLGEIGATGARTRDVFSRAIDNLNRTVVSSVLSDTRSQAALAIDIMDRNLYERANDCRWWALTTQFRLALDEREISANLRAELTATLSSINALYTVYTNILLFDARGELLASSQPGSFEPNAEVLPPELLRETLALSHSDAYCVSRFAQTPLYGGRATYVYCAAIRSLRRSSRVVGGIALVFDAEPQFRAMLSDALPRDDAGNLRANAFGVIAAADGTIVASTREDLAPCSRLALPREISGSSAGQGWQAVLPFDGMLYAVGASPSLGYREYKGPKDPYRNDVSALVFVPLSSQEGQEAVASGVDRSRRERPTTVSSGEASIDLGTFACDDAWYALPAAELIEAVSASQLNPVHGLPQHIAGYLRLHGRILTVLDLGRLLNRKRPPTARAEQHILVVRESREHAAFGLLVDGLGDNPEVARSRVADVPEGVRNSFVAHLVRPDERVPDDSILYMLSLDALRASARLDTQQTLARTGT